MRILRAAAALLAALLLLLMTACGLVPSQPTAQDWRSTAVQSLETTASEVATARMVLQQEKKEQLLGQFGAVALTNAEKAVGSTQDTILTQQPPDGLQDEFDRVSTVLGDAGDLMTQARIALVGDDRTAYADLIDELDGMTQRLDELRRSLGGAP